MPAERQEGGCGAAPTARQESMIDHVNNECLKACLAKRRKRERDTTDARVEAVRLVSSEVFLCDTENAFIVENY